MNTKPTPNHLAEASKSKYWQHIRKLDKPCPTLSTGFAELDETLSLGGWSLDTTTELGVSDYGIGELRLLMPALRELMADAKPYMVWIAPPFVPYAPALTKEDIDPAQLIIVRPNSVIDTLWVAEQALLANSCTAVFTWTGNYNLNQKETRRLQLAVEKSAAWHVQFRHSNCLQHTSAARLRLNLQSNAFSELDITICKQPQWGTKQHCTLSLEPHYELWRRIPTELLPQHNTPLPIGTLKLPQKTKLEKGSLSHSLLAD